MIFLLLGIAMGLFAIVLLLFGFASTGLTRETICDGTKCIRSGISCAVVVSSNSCRPVLSPVLVVVVMYRCLHGMAPLYLMDSCTPTADVAGRQHLRSVSQRKLIVPHYRYRLNSFGRRCFAVAGPST